MMDVKQYHLNSSAGIYVIENVVENANNNNLHSRIPKMYSSIRLLRQSFFCIILAIISAVPLQAQINPISYPDYVTPVEKEKLPPKLEYKGDFKFAVQWMEAGKRQVLIASEVQHPSELRNDLFLKQYGFGNGRYGQVWSLKEFAPRLCTVKLIENSLQVIDLDGDGKQEVSFSYQVDHKEGQPTVKKAILYQNGVKFGIRGKFSAEDGEEIESAVDSSIVTPSAIGWFLGEEWERIKSGKEAFAHTILHRGAGWFLVESRSLRGLSRVFYDVRLADGTEINIADSLRNRLQYARAIYPTPQGELLYISDEGIGKFNPSSGVFQELLPLPETTEGVSKAAWSPDSSMVALVVLNVDEYPKSTRLFVIELDAEDGPGEVHEIDILVSHYGFDEWTIEPPVFVNDRTLKVLEVSWDQESDGAWTEFELE
jgi:hypothetical protein